MNYNFQLSEGAGRCRVAILQKIEEVCLMAKWAAWQNSDISIGQGVRQYCCIAGLQEMLLVLRYTWIGSTLEPYDHLRRGLMKRAHLWRL